MRIMSRLRKRPKALPWYRQGCLRFNQRMFALALEAPSLSMAQHPQMSSGWTWGISVESVRNILEQRVGRVLRFRAIPRIV